jgi:hypothetical protein
MIGYLLGRIVPMIHRTGKMKPMRPSTQWPLRKQAGEKKMNSKIIAARLAGG